VRRKRSSIFLFYDYVCDIFSCCGKGLVLSLPVVCVLFFLVWLQRMEDDMDFGDEGFEHEENDEEIIQDDSWSVISAYFEGLNNGHRIFFFFFFFFFIGFVCGLFCV
jgi:hypothetical protein